jgi:mono/diheme cytochrome c family protein
MKRIRVRSIQKKVWVMGVGLAVMVAALAACESNATNQDAAKPAGGVTPAEMQVGEAKFTANCAACHGVRGVGTKQGPPLVHKIYEPNHHADMAFQRAAENGVRAHHWEFGNMPKIEGVTSGDVEHIIRYVRWLQREGGIY